MHSLTIITRSFHIARVHAITPTVHRHEVQQIDDNEHDVQEEIEEFNTKLAQLESKQKEIEKRVKESRREVARTIEDLLLCHATAIEHDGNGGDG
jgi:peptidoglycan hydrolase CwlO-like protein